MLIIQHIDWFGPQDELKEMDEAIKKACGEIDRISRLRKRLFKINPQYL